MRSRGILCAVLVFLAPVLVIPEPNSERLPDGFDTDAAFLARVSGLFRADDPTSIYDFAVSDKKVEFVLDGNWALDLKSAVRLSFDGAAPSVSLSPPVFTQAVDLSSWIFIDNTWYFEADFAEAFTKNSIAFGYVGTEETAVKHVRIGNSKITFPGTYTFVDIGGGTAISPGFMGTFGGKNWSADTIVRYDAATARELILSGMNTVTDEYIPVSSFTEGKWFILPDENVAGAVSVYVQDDSGTITETDGRAKGRRWRKLNAAEYSVSGISGLVELKHQARGAVAVAYGGTYASGGTAGTGLKNRVADVRNWFDLCAAGAKKKLPSGYLPDPSISSWEADLADRFLVRIAGTQALVVREPGYFSPFALSSRYAAATDEPVIAFRESGIIPDYIAAEAIDGATVELYRTGNGSKQQGSLAERLPEAMFPLAKEYPLIYLPSAGGRKIDTDLCLRARAYQEISTISLGQNAIAGTIKVLRNGVGDTAFSFDESTGLLKLSREPALSENIKITWLDTVTGARNAALTVGGGVEWKPAEPLSLTLASAFRWNVSKSGYTAPGDTSPGSFTVTGGAGWAVDSISAKTAFAYEASVADTTGYYRILGMDDSPRTLYPEASWYRATPDAIAPAIGNRQLDPANRAALAHDPGSTVRTVTDSSATGSILAMSCDLPAAESWASADILAGSKGSADFRSAGSVAVSLKNVGTTADYSVTLQIGTGTSDFYEDAHLVVSRTRSAPAPGAGWITWTVTLTDAERSALSAGCDMRLIVTPGAAATGKNPVRVALQSGPFETTASGFAGSAAPDFTPGTRGAIRLGETADTAATALDSAKQDIVRRFNASAINTVLRAEFTPDVPAQSIAVSANVAGIPIGDYRYIAFFFAAPKGPPVGSGATVRIRLTEPAESSTAGIAAVDAVIPAEALGTGWQEITVDLEAAAVSVDGVTVPGSAVSVRARETKPTQVSILFENWPVPSVASAAGEFAYEILVDEVHLKEPAVSNNLKNRTDFAWKKNGAILSAGAGDSAVALFSDASVELSGLTTKNLAAARPAFSGSAKGGISILQARADATITASSAIARVIDSTSHIVSVPLGPVRLSESWAADFSGSAYTRSDSVSLPEPFAVRLATSLREQSRRLERGISLTVAPTIPESTIGSFPISALASVSQNGIAPLVNLSNVPWETLWTTSFMDALSSGEPDATRRTSRAAFSAGWNAPGESESRWGLSGIALETSGESRYTHGSSTALSSTIAFGTSFPISLGYSTLTPSWKRQGIRKSKPEAGGSYRSDAEYVASSLGDQPWLYGVAPLADLVERNFCAPMREQSLYSREFSNKYGLGWSRPSAGRLSDVWIPNAVDASISRTTITDAKDASFSDGWGTDLSCGFSALNVAGSYGALKLFRWYEQDELSQRYAWSTSWGEGYLTWNLDLLHSVLLLFANEGSVSLDNTFHYDSPDIAGANELTKDAVKLLWKRPGKTSFASAAIARFVRLPLGTKREDSLTFSISKNDKLSIATNYDHILRTLIGKNAEAHVSTGLGATAADGRLRSIEMKLGIGGKLSY